MECAAYREAVSARIDGEDTGLEAAAIDAHLAECPTCRSWADTAIAVTRSARIGLAEPVPNLADAIVVAMMAGAERNTGARPVARGKAAVTRARRWPAPAARGAIPASPGKVARWGLAMVALAQACLAVPALMGHDAGAPVHVAHEQGAWALALALALAFVAIRPVRAGALLPFVAALSAGLAVTMVVDIAGGHTEAAAEAPHGLTFLGLGMLWLLSRHVQAPASTTRDRVGTRGMAEAA